MKIAGDWSSPSEVCVYLKKEYRGSFGDRAEERCSASVELTSASMIVSVCTLIPYVHVSTERCDAF